MESNLHMMFLSNCPIISFMVLTFSIYLVLLKMIMCHFQYQPHRKWNKILRSYGVLNSVYNNKTIKTNYNLCDTYFTFCIISNDRQSIYRIPCYQHFLHIICRFVEELDNTVEAFAWHVIFVSKSMQY
jgi:hypothetical protein